MKLIEVLTEKTETPELSLGKFNPDIGADMIGNVGKQGSGNNKSIKFLAAAGGQVFKFDDETSARQFVDEYNNKKVKKRTKFVNKYSSQRIGFKEKAKDAWKKIGDVPSDKRSRIGKLVDNSMKGMGNVLGRVLTVAGVDKMLYDSLAYNIAYYNDQAELGVENGGMTQQEAQENIYAVQAAYGAQFVALIAYSLKRWKSASAIIKLVRGSVRTIQLATAATGAGFVPALVSAIATEAAFVLATWYLTKPSVQRAFAEWLVDLGMASIMETLAPWVDKGVQLKAQALEQVTSGAIDANEMLTRGGFTPGKGRTTPSGTAYASSEWAKLTFQNSLFPPGTSSQLVEYIPPGERQRLILNAMELSESPQDRVRSTGAAQPGARSDGTGGNANVSGQPG